MLGQEENPLCHDIVQAISHLSDLARKMKSADFGFKESDVDNIDSIIESINELENQRSILHDQLEAETIKCSILRHEFKYLPEQYRQEIHDAVVQARQSNQDLVQSLGDRLVQIDNSIEELTDRQEYLEKDNALKMPERDRLRLQHEQVITVLNQRMAEKATIQITLNETRDKLRNTQSKIMDLEDDLLQLKEDMIKERADARATRARLRSSINETNELTANQNKDNHEAKSQLDHLTKRLGHTETDLEDLRKVIDESDTARLKGEGEALLLNNQINNQLKENDDLRKLILDLGRKKIETQQKYEAELKNMQKRVEGLQAQIRAKEDRHAKLGIRCQELTAEADMMVEKLQFSKEQVAELTTILNDAKEALVRKQEDIARLREENSRMEQEIIDLGETHKVVMENFNRQILEYREQLGKERKERIEVQQKRDGVQKNLEAFKTSNNQFMTSITKKVTKGKAQHEELTHEGSTLQKEMKEMDDKINQARLDVRDAKISYDLKKAEVEESLSKLKLEVESHEKTLNDARTLMDHKVPEFARQTTEFQEAQIEFDKVKKQVAGMKSQKASLDDQVKRTRVAIEKAIKPQADIKEDLKTRREKFMTEMKQQLEEAEDLERQVYVVGTKFQTIVDENQRFEESNKEYEQELELLEREKIICDDDVVKLRAEHGLLKSLLLSNWEEDEKMEKQSTERDLEILNKLADVLKVSNKRSGVVSHVSNTLDEELSNLANFLDSVAERRPKDEPTVVDAGTLTVGSSLKNRGAQPSKNFFKRQQIIDEMSIMVPPSGNLSVDFQEYSRSLDVSSSVDGYRKSSQLNRRSPLPPIQRTDEVAISAVGHVHPDTAPAVLSQRLSSSRVS